MERYQATINRKIEMTGTGLHCGRTVHLEILPAPVNSGIVFQRIDDLRARPVSASPRNISSTDLCTSIGEGPSKVSTIEHLMAALRGMGVDNAVVRLDAPEIPIMDGSALPFVEAIQAAGVHSQDGFRRLLVVKKEFELRDGDRWIRVSPSPRQIFECEIDYKSEAIGRQTLELPYSHKTFLDLCGARTFCHVNEVNAMREAGLALGGSLDNAVVVTDTGVMNEEGLRSDDEFVRHKVLDCIGDLALLGAPLVGRIALCKPGHGLHAEFMRKIWAERHTYLTIVELGADQRRAAPAAAESIAAVAAASAVNS